VLRQLLEEDNDATLLELAQRGECKGQPS